jgi:tetratricopeptide (TPR) repeat protein
VWRYGTRDVAQILGLSASRVRAWARAGLLSPERGSRGALRFSFPDLVLLRAARELLAARVPAARVRRALLLLRAQLPTGRSLAKVRIAADGERVVVRDGGALYCPESGQMLLDFEVKDVAEQVAPLLVRTANAELDAEAFYEWGCDLEDGAPEQAAAAYRRALALEPRHYGANVNLGRLLHEAHAPEAAERHYRLALEACPGDACALFNLGVALEDRGRDEDALAAYEACVATDARHADAHHNAGRLCERLGRHKQALRHLGAARRLTRAEGG